MIQTMCFNALLVIMLITEYGKYVSFNDVFRFCSNLAFNVIVSSQVTIFSLTYANIFFNVQVFQK